MRIENMESEDLEGDEAFIVTVGDDQTGGRADKILTALCPDLSRTRIQSLIEQSQVRVNDKIITSSSAKLQAGDRIEITIPAPAPSAPEAENIRLDIVYEDDYLLVINKPPGMVVHPGAGNWTGTLVNALLYHCRDSLSGIGGVIRPGIVHRLDKDTSGLMLVAKNDLAHRHLASQLSDRTLSRLYLAITTGVPVPIKGTIDRPIGRHRHNRLKMSVMGNDGREARTGYRVLQNFGEACAQVECRLETGRTHQIRVHMEAAGYPLVGDKLYGPQKTALESKLKKAGYTEKDIETISAFPRQALHAQGIEFIHPETEEPLSFTCDLPGDMEKIIKILKNNK